MSERINNASDTTIIEGPEEVLSSKDVNNPRTTEAIPAKMAIIIICFGLLLRLRAMAAGIKSNPVIKRAPIIFIDNAITPANKSVKIKLEISGLIPSAAAKS